MTDTIAITLFGCNASDDAWACGISDDIDDHHAATISTATHDAIVAARKALDANPAWESIAIASDVTCKPLEDALESAEFWRTGNEEFLIYRFPGLYLRLLSKDNRQAEIEFDVVYADGRSIPTPSATGDTATPTAESPQQHCYCSRVNG